MMLLPELCAALDRLGVRIASDGRGRVRAMPADGVLDFLPALKRYKPEILRRFGQVVGLFRLVPCAACGVDLTVADCVLCDTCAQLSGRSVRLDDERVRWFLEPFIHERPAVLDAISTHPESRKEDASLQTIPGKTVQNCPTGRNLDSSWTVRKKTVQTVHVPNLFGT